MGRRKRKHRARKARQGTADAGGAPSRDESPSAQAAAPDSPAVERRPPSRGYDRWRENLEAIIVAFILALIIRHFAVEAFEIPTGSMAPTLYGIHAWAKCPNCDTTFNMGLGSDESNHVKASLYEHEKRWVYWGRCPNSECGLPHHRAYPERGSRLGGSGQLVPGQESFTCPHCKTRWVGDPADFKEEFVLRRPGSGWGDIVLECPMCQFSFKDVITRENRTGGHKILVDKNAFRIGTPRRWDVIVFHFNEQKNYIKRLLGLPGERVWIRGGDLYVQRPGERHPAIARKIDAPAARESLWFRIADSDVRERGFNPVPAWKEVFERGARLREPIGAIDHKWWLWDEETLRFQVNVLKPAGRVACLRFSRRCDSFYNYNLVSENPMTRRQRFEVGDKKVVFQVTPSAAGERAWIGGEIREGEFTYQLRIPVGAASEERPATLRRLITDPDPGRPSPDRKAYSGRDGEQSAAAPAALPLERASTVEFENVDDRVAVAIDGREVLAIEYTSGSPQLHSPEDHGLVLMASNVSAVLESVRVFRDIYYTPISGSRTVSGGQPIGSVATTGENEYFPCGDNSPSSSDGRMWGTFPERSLMGKAFVVFWPVGAGPSIGEWKWQLKFIR